jgi:hypothetical protein
VSRFAALRSRLAQQTTEKAKAEEETYQMAARSA